ncbi:MAG TPA: ABC transporter ATP-binding protein [Microthrixaceae bacterium]|nr:ABC transporter ATP-binding protein [Microthrixaceae bacterium]
MSDAPPMPGYAARAYDVTQRFGEGDTQVVALDSVTLGFEWGRFTAIMGPSGSGKTTLVQGMAGLDHFTDGRVFIGEVEITRMPAQALTMMRRDHLGFIFQSYNLVPSLTAAKNIVLPLKLAKQRADPQVFAEVTERLRIADRLDHRPSELSGGQQQRVAIARALVARPALIIADEPTGNLDSSATIEVLSLLRSVVDDDRRTVVMVTHDPHAAARADRVVMLADGRIVDDLVAPDAATLIDRLGEIEIAPPQVGPPEDGPAEAGPGRL